MTGIVLEVLNIATPSTGTNAADTELAASIAPASFGCKPCVTVDPIQSVYPGIAMAPPIPLRMTPAANVHSVPPAIITIVPEIIKVMPAISRP